MTKKMEGLILCRKRDQNAVIDLREFGLGLFYVKVVEAKGSTARLMFSGERRIPVHRQEVFDAIERAKATEPAA